MDNIHTANGNVETADKHPSVAAVEGEGQNLNSDCRRLSPTSVAMETSKVTTATTETVSNSSALAKQPSPPPAPDKPEDQNNNNQKGSSPAHSRPAQVSSSPPPAPPTLPKVGKDIVISADISFC